MRLNIDAEINKLNATLVAGSNKKKNILKELDLFVLDNSVRETTVGQMAGHTLEDKIKIYQEAKKCGFKYLIVAAFNIFGRVGEAFCQWLFDKGEDMSKLFSFSELIHCYREEDENVIRDRNVVPIALKKCQKFGIKNVLIEMDLADPDMVWEGDFTIERCCALLKERIDWCYENLSPDAKIMFDLRDMATAMNTSEGAKRVISVVHYLASLPKKIFGICFEESGEFLPEEMGAFTASIQRVMNKANWNHGQLLVHIHKRWGLSHQAQLECLVNGATGVWSGVCEEGAAVGHCSSIVTIMNLVRMGNSKVLEKYNCKYLRQAAINVTEITTGKQPHFRELIYGERALDYWYSADISAVKEFDLAGFFDLKPPVRVSGVSSCIMVRQRLIDLFGDDPQFTIPMAKNMKELLFVDMSTNRKEEYMSAVGIAMLFDRAGGKMTVQMRDVIEKEKVNSPHMNTLISEVKKMWAQWQLTKKEQKEDYLRFDSFYNGFMVPYFDVLDSDSVRKALQALDMSSDGCIDWSEFSVYLKWAAREYPSIMTRDELLSTAFSKGLIPAMWDETINS